MAEGLLKFCVGHRANGSTLFGAQCLGVIGVVDVSLVATCECVVVVGTNINLRRNVETVVDVHVVTATLISDESAPAIRVCSQQFAIKSTVSDVDIGICVANESCMIGIIILCATIDSNAAPAVNDIQGAVILIANKTCCISVACINSTCYMQAFDSHSTIIAVAERRTIIAVGSQVERHGVTITVEGTLKAFVCAGACHRGYSDVGCELEGIAGIGFTIVDILSEMIPVRTIINKVRTCRCTFSIEVVFY